MAHILGRRFRVHTLVIMSVLLSAFLAEAQIINVTGDQAPPIPGAGHDYIHMLNETVNPGTGSVSIRINVPVPPSRGFTVPFAFGYDSNAALHLSPSGWTDNSKLGRGGWTYVYPQITSSTNAVVSGSDSPVDRCVYWLDFLMIDISGASHALGISPFETLASNDSLCGGDEILPTGQVISNVLAGADAQVQAVTSIPTGPNVPPVIVADMDGRVYHFPGAPNQNFSAAGGPPDFIEDRNGNKATFAIQRNPNNPNIFTTSLTDTVGRTAFSFSNFGVDGGTVSVSGFSSPYKITWSQQTPTGSFPVSGPFTAPPPDPGQTTPTCNSSLAGYKGAAEITQITLPNGQAYQFRYDPVTSLLSKMIYPDGGYVRYTWELSPSVWDTLKWPANTSTVQVCTAEFHNYVLQNRFVSFDGTNELLEQDFAYQVTGAWTQRQVTVTTTVSAMVNGTKQTTSSFSTVNTYVPMVVPAQPNDLVIPGSGVTPVESMIQYFPTAFTTGQPLRTVTKSYVDPNLPPDETTTLDNGLTSQVHNVYIANTGKACSNSGPLCVLTDQYSYDFGAGKPGALLKRTHTDYATFAATPIFPSAASILDRPKDVITYDGSGNEMAETDYAYDGTSVSSVSNATAHDETNYSSSSNVRGNATTVAAKCLQTGCANSVTTYTYDETGQTLTMTDPCGNGTCSDMSGTSHITTYSYNDSYTVLSSGANAAFTPSGNTDAYLTKITDPLGHTESFTYDFNTGQLTILKDQNSQTTTYLYNDAFARPTRLTYPDGGQTEYAYNDAPPSPTVTTCRLISGTAGATCSPTTPPAGWITSVAVMDGMDHVVQTQLASDPDGTTYTSTTYDGLERKYQSYNPTRCSPPTTNCGKEATWGFTTYTFDALGRATNVTDPDGSATTTSYSGNQTTVTDEAGNQRQNIADSLGRLVQVNEPGPTGSGAAGTNASGTFTVNGSEESTLTQPMTSGTGSVNVTGSERKGTLCPASGPCFAIYDCGTVSVTVKSHATSVQYGYAADGNLACNEDTSTNTVVSTDSAGAVVGRLVSAINADTGAFVNASTCSAGICLTSRTTGMSTNYTLSANSATSLPASVFASGTTSFPISASGSALTGGSNGQTTFDSGTVAVTVGSFTATVSYNSSSTASSVASALATALSATNSPITATASGATVSLTANSVGVSGNVPVSSSTTSSQPAFFPSGSFSVPGTNMSGGSDAVSMTYSLSTPLVTLYTYNALNALTCAVQKGTDTTAFSACASAPATWRPRSFVYDSLSRLTSANNPESGTITYTYDLNSNIVTKIEPEANQTGTVQTTSTYAYDALNRVLSKEHMSPANANAFYQYDGTALSGCTGPVPPGISGATNLIGRRSSMCTGVSASSFSYDSMGRTQTEARKNQGSSAKTYTVGYAHNSDGSLKTLTYPSGDVVTYTVGGAERVTAVSDSANNYVGFSGNTAKYAPNGSLATMTHGNSSSFAGIVTTNAYNNRLQPSLLSATANNASIISLTYDFRFGNGDNGKVRQVINNLDSTRSATYQYDALNRLQLASTNATTGANCWSEVYTIDTWGNLTNRGGVSGMGSCNTEGLSATANTKNQLSILTYDAAGDVTNDGTGNQPTYDAEKRIATDAGFTYQYDADGVRMYKSSGSSGTLYWPGPSGENLTETDLTGTINEEYIYFNGARIARVDRPSGTVHYYFSNHLGSATVITDASGDVQEQTDYYPYGGIAFTSGSDPNHYKFTGKERDSESNLDNFGARYFASSMGRFMTPDWAVRPTAVPYAVFGDPQSLNLYTYVRNDPVTRADADGHLGSQAYCDTDDQGCGQKQQQAKYDALANAFREGHRGILSNCGFWCGVGQRFGNLFSGKGFHTDEQLLPKGTITTTETYEVHEPKPAITAATDVAGLVGALAPKASEKLHLGPATALVSMGNDPSPRNITINIVGLIPGVDVPVAINGAFIDFFDYKIHQDTPGHDKSQVIPTNLCSDGACVPNPDLAPCGGFC